MDCSRLRTGRGHGLFTATGWVRTVTGRPRSRSWIDCGRGCGQGQDMVTDWTQPRSWRGCGLFASWTRSRTGHGHGWLAGLWRGHSASKPRPLRGRKNLRWRRSKACPVLNMMRNTLPPLLQQFVAPALQLRGEGLNTADLFNFQHFDSCGAVIAEMCVRQLNDQVGGILVDVFAKFFEHLDGSANLGGGWCLHNQMFRCGCREMVCVRFLADVLDGVWKASVLVAIQLPRPDAPTVH